MEGHDVSVVDFPPFWKQEGICVRALAVSAILIVAACEQGGRARAGLRCDREPLEACEEEVVRTAIAAGAASSCWSDWHSWITTYN